MFKKMISVSAAVGVAVILSGCEMITDITINPDGETAVVQSTMKIEASEAALMADIDATSTEAICEALNEEGGEDDSVWVAEGDECVTSEEMTLKFDDKGVIEVTSDGVTEEIVEVDDDGVEVDELIELDAIEDPDFVIKRVDDGVLFSMPVEGEETAEMIGMGVELTFNVTYPGKVLEINNGGVISEDGKTATWVFSDLEGEDTIESIGSIEESAGINAGLIIGGIAVILIAGGVVWYLISRKKEGEEEVVEEVMIEEIS